MHSPNRKRQVVWTLNNESSDSKKYCRLEIVEEEYVNSKVADWDKDHDTDVEIIDDNECIVLTSSQSDDQNDSPFEFSTNNVVCEYKTRQDVHFQSHCELVNKIECKLEVVDHEQIEIKKEQNDSTDDEVEAMVSAVAHAHDLEIKRETIKEIDESFSNGLLSFACDKCFKIFFNVDRYDEHVSRCTMDPVRKSVVLNENTNTKQLLMENFTANNLNNVSINDNSLNGFRNKRVSNDETEFDSDNESSDDENDYVKQICKSSKTVYKMYDYEHKVDGETKYQCDRCDRYFTLFSNLKRHMRAVHDKQRFFSCKLCDKRFTRRSYVKMHRLYSRCFNRNAKNSTNNSAMINKVIELKEYEIKTDENDRFLCDYCEKTFTTLGNVKRHREELHLNKRYECKRCFTSFKRKHEVDRHMSTVHFGTKMKGLNIERNDEYVCYYCGKTFKKCSSWKRHLEVHTKVRLFVCHFCDLEFCDKNKLIRHLVKQH